MHIHIIGINANFFIIGINANLISYQDSKFC